MRSLLLASMLLATTAAAQTPQPNLFDIWVCTNYASRGALGANGGDDLLQVPRSAFVGVGTANNGIDSELIGFQFVIQDQNAATEEPYSLIVRADANGRPDATAAGLLCQLGPLTSPSGTGTQAWLVTVDFPTPALNCLPLCATWYVGMNVLPAHGWPSNGLSFHIGTQALLGGTQAGNPSPVAGPLSHLAWNIIGGTGGTPTQPGGPRIIRYGVRVRNPVLRTGGTDPTLIGNTANCVSTLLNSAGNPTCYATGGMYPGASGGRSDGLDCRVRHAANAGGVFVTFLGTPVPSSGRSCGLPLGGLANGALYLNPSGVFVQVAAGSLDTTGQGTAVILPPNSGSFSGLMLSFQSFTVGPSFTLPGALSNRCTVTYL